MKTIKIPRVRMSDCCRLIFRLSEEPVWRDMDLDPDLFPIYPLPDLPRNIYYLSDHPIRISPGCTINDIVRQVCKIFPGDGRTYLHTMIFGDTGDLEIQTETI